MRWRSGGSELASCECASDAPPTSFGRAVGEEDECRGGTGRPRPIQMAVREATKTRRSHGRIPDFFTLFRVHEPRRQSQCHGDSIRRRWHYFKISTPATIQRGPRRPPEHRHHQPPPPPLRIAPMAPLRVPGTGRRSQAAPSHLNTNLDPLSYHTPSRSTEIPSGGRKYTETGL